jgi:hypothetical protein
MEGKISKWRKRNEKKKWLRRKYLPKMEGDNGVWEELVC